MRVKLSILAAGLLVASPAVAILEAGTADAGKATPAHDYCRSEDGSGQRVCVWDAGHQGNGAGDSFIAINGGTDRARYVYVSHAKAHRLTH